MGLTQPGGDVPPIPDLCRLETGEHGCDWQPDCMQTFLCSPMMGVLWHECQSRCFSEAARLAHHCCCYNTDMVQQGWYNTSMVQHCSDNTVGTAAPPTVAMQQPLQVPQPPPAFLTSHQQEAGILDATMKFVVKNTFIDDVVNNSKPAVPCLRRALTDPPSTRTSESKDTDRTVEDKATRKEEDVTPVPPLYRTVTRERWCNRQLHCTPKDAPLQQPCCGQQERLRASSKLTKLVPFKNGSIIRGRLLKRNY